MHPVIAFGLQIMRDPAQKQAFWEMANIDGGRCAYGCICEAAVRIGCGTWETMSHGRLYHNLTDWEEQMFNIAQRELRDHMYTPVITGMNDFGHFSLPEIADRIEQVYGGGR